METRAQVWRRWKRGLTFIAALYALGLASTFGWVLYKTSAHRRWHDQVEYCILRLAPMRPLDVTPEQWSCCLHWTWNLHANYGWMGYFPDDEREPFLADFERHLKEPVSLATIDAIWDDYGRHAPKALAYMHYRPTTPPMLPDAAGKSQYQGYDSLDSWIEKLKKREQGR